VASRTIRLSGVPDDAEVCAVFNWLWQSLVGNILTLFLVSAAGVGVAFLKRRTSSWLFPSLYGLAAAALMAVILICLMGASALPKKQPSLITDDKVESAIRGWLDDFGLSTKVVTDQGLVFGMETNLTNGDPLTIVRLKEHDRYIVVQATLMLAPVHKAILDKLSKEESDQVFRQVNLELALSRIPYQTPEPLTAVTFATRLPLSGITEDSFIEKVDEVESGIIIARSTIVTELSRFQVSSRH
jgi:hypothetical protein